MVDKYHGFFYDDIFIGGTHHQEWLTNDRMADSYEAKRSVLVVAACLGMLAAIVAVVSHVYTLQLERREKETEEFGSSTD